MFVAAETKSSAFALGSKTARLLIWVFQFLMPPQLIWAEWAWTWVPKSESVSMGDVSDSILQIIHIISTSIVQILRKYCVIGIVPSRNHCVFTRWKKCNQVWKKRYSLFGIANFSKKSMYPILRRMNEGMNVLEYNLHVHSILSCKRKLY